MTAIAGGEFTIECDPMTINDCLTHEEPAHTVRPLPIQIDRTKVTIGAFALCVAADALRGYLFGLCWDEYLLPLRRWARWS